MPLTIRFARTVWLYMMLDDGKKQIYHFDFQQKNTVWEFLFPVRKQFVQLVQRTSDIKMGEG